LLAAPLFLLLLAADPAGPPARLSQQSASPSAEFNQGSIAFARAEYSRAIEILRPLLYPEIRLQSEGEIATAHRMLGTAYLFVGDEANAAEEFRRFLQLRPAYRLDPLLDPPMVVDFFDRVVQEQEEELEEFQRKRQEAEAREAARRASNEEPTIIVQRYVKNSYAVNFIPFGAGQFQNGQRSKGWFFLTTQSVLAGTSLAALATNFALYGMTHPIGCEPANDPTARGPGCAPGFLPNSEKDRSRMILRVQLISGALFWVTAAWGVVDALLNYQPQVLLESVQPPGAKTPSRTAAKKTAQTGSDIVSDVRLGVAFVGEGALGGGLTFRF